MTFSYTELTILTTQIKKYLPLIHWVTRASYNHLICTGLKIIIDLYWKYCKNTENSPKAM